MRESTRQTALSMHQKRDDVLSAAATDCVLRPRVHPTVGLLTDRESECASQQL